MSRTLRLAVVLLSLFSATFILKASLPQVSTGVWQAAGSLATARAGAAAVALPDGRILITGGSDGSGAPMSSAELFNTDGTFSSAVAMKAARSGHAAIVLPDGRVLVTGGRTSGGGITNSAETYDPQTNAWQMLSATTVEARTGHTMSQLLNGDVLLAGGESSGGPVSALEVFDETNDTFTSAGALITARQDHAAAVLSDGRVLIAGGTGVDASGNPTTLSSTETYDGGTGAVAAGPALATARVKLSATTLLDGRVALVGGNDGSNDVGSIEIYDPAAGTIVASPASLATARSGHQAFLLPHNGSVLVVGGTSAGTELGSAELFVPWNTAVEATGAMGSARSGAAGAPLSTIDGLLLVAGGKNSSAGTLASGELYGFATVKTDQSDYAPGTTVNITGSGWQPGETVTLTLVESPNIDIHPPMTAVADQHGNISNSEFSPDSHDLDVRFYLTAVGAQSQAQTTFTDATPTNTSLTSSPNPSNLNQSVTFTATVRSGNTQGSGSLVTVGSVDFYNQTGVTNPNCGGNAGTQIGTTQTVNGSGTATVSFSFTSAGSYKIGTCYKGVSGSNGTQDSSSPSITQTVNGVTVSATNSTVSANPASLTADGSSTSTITVTLKDTSNNPVSGKAVSLTAGSGSSTITPVSGTSNSSGQAIFSAKDAVAESVTYAAKDTTDNISVTQTATVSFTAGSVNAGSSTVIANPTSVTADGTASSTITVTLKDANNNPVSGKAVALAQGSGNSTISAASGPSNSSGVVTFTVKDTKAETVTYSATDTTDSIAITQTAAVGFTPGPATKFVVSAPATANLGAAFSFTVTAQDANNNTATGYAGTVHFTSSDAQAVLPPNSTLTSGTGTFSATLKKASNQTIAGTDTVTATITGTSNNINVSKADTTVSTTSSQNPSVYGQSVTFTATVNPATPGAGTPSGTVTFKEGTTTLDTLTLSGGQATFNTSSLGVASHSVTAEYVGDSNFNGSTSSALSQTVNQADTITSLVSSANPSVFGQSVTFTASVSAVAPGAGTATGTVTFKDGTTTVGTGTLNASGQATFTTSALSVSGSPHNVTALYGGDGNFNGSTSSALNQTVNKADTNTDVVSSANPSVFGQSVTFTATVSAVAPGTGTPSGTVTFKDGATTLGTGTLSGGQVSFSTSSLNVASHPITAEYGADSNFNAGTSLPLSQVVNKADTNTSVVSSANPSVFGQSVTFTATVSAAPPGSGMPTGTVTFKDEGTPLGTGTLDGSGQATFSTTFLSAASHPITAAYVGDSNFNGSASSNLSQTVNKADTTTTITSDTPDPSVVGQSVTVNYSVTVNAPGGGAPTGNVTVSDGTVSCTSTVTAGSCSLSFTSAGAKSLTATYTGDSNFKSSISAAAPHTVDRASTSTAISSSVNPSVFGQSVTVTATVTVIAPGAGTPTGTVTFKDGITILGAGALTGSGQAAFSTSSLSVASHSITAEYGGDSNFSNSASQALDQTVNKADTTTTAVSSANPSLFGQPVTFTATVSVVVPGAGAPTGTVTFMDGANTLAWNVALNGLQAAFTSSSLSVGPHSITAVYSGDGNFKSSTGNLTGGQVVNKASTSIMVSNLVNPSILNQSVTFTATVGVTAPGAGTPTGGVNFMDGAITLAANVALNGPQATFTTSSLSVGSHSITAVYGGDGNFNGSTSSVLSQLVQYEPAGTLCLGAAGHQILQPINADGTSVFKQGSTVPAKFRVCDVNGTSIGTASVVTSFRLISIQNGTVVSTVDESVDSTTPDSSFRWDPTNMQWIFNMNTKILSANKTYAYLITLNDGTTIGLQFGLK